MKTVEQLFDFKTSQAELTKFLKDIQNKYTKENGYGIIPREWWPYLYKALTLRTHDSKGSYKESDIKCWISRKRDGKQCILFVNKDNEWHSLGIVNAVKEWQAQKNKFWVYKKDTIIKVLRNISNIKVEKFKKDIILPIKDEVTGEVLTSMKDIQIDHYDDDFIIVAYDWLYEIKKINEQYNKRPCDIISMLYDIIDEKKLYFKERKTNLAFYKYHNAHTHLRVVSAKTNNGRPKYRINWDILKTNGKYIEQYEREKKSD